MSMLRTLKRGMDRTPLAREVRHHAGKPVSSSRNKIAKKWQRARLKMARYARLVVGLLIRATGCADDTTAPLHLVSKIPTPHQERAQAAETIINSSDKLSFKGWPRLEADRFLNLYTGEGVTWAWVPGTSRTVAL